VNARAASDGAQWLVLLEKAFAKLYINYANLAGGQPAEALRAMTGMPVAMYNTGNLSDAKLFTSIQEAEQKGYVMLATCENAVHNLEPGHSYTILSALEVKADNGKAARLIKMRNPWSTETYEGPWSLDDETWTPEMKS
jgi:calpain-15